MPIPLLSRFKRVRPRTPLEDIEAQTKKIKECTWAFQQALECHHNKSCETFEDHRQDVIRLAKEAHALKEQVFQAFIVSRYSKIQTFVLLTFMNEQASIVATLEKALEWLTFRNGALVPPVLEKDFFLLFDSVIDPIEELSKLVSETQKFLKKHSAKQRSQVEKVIDAITEMELEANRLEERLKRKIFSAIDDTASLFHLVRMAEIIALISDKAGSAGNVMRAIVAVG